MSAHLCFADQVGAVQARLMDQAAAVPAHSRLAGRVATVPALPPVADRVDGSEVVR